MTQLPLDEGTDLTWNELCDQGAEQLHAPATPISRDIRSQILAAGDLNTIKDIKPSEEYL